MCSCLPGWGISGREVLGMRMYLAIAALVIASVLAGCGGSSGGSGSRAPVLSEPFRFLPPSITFTYRGTATVNEAGANRTVPVRSTVTIGPPGFTDPRTNTPVLLYTQTVDVETVENLLYRDFFFSQPESLLVAHGSEVFGVAAFTFGPTLLLPAQLVVGQSLGQRTEPYQTLVVTSRDVRVVRKELIAVAGAVVDAFEVHLVRAIPFSRTITREFAERSWYAPGIAGPVPVKQEIRYAHNGKAVTARFEIVGIPTLP